MKAVVFFPFPLIVDILQYLPIFSTFVLLNILCDPLWRTKNRSTLIANNFLLVWLFVSVEITVLVQCRVGD